MSIFNIIKKHTEIQQERVNQAEDILKRLKENLADFKFAPESIVKEKKREIEESFDNFEAFRLFGTSGIRAIFENKIEGSCVDDLTNKNIITPKLAYYFGRGLGKMLISYNNNVEKIKKAYLGMDVRNSSVILASCVAEGLCDEGIDVYFNGIVTTPIAMIFGRDNLSIEITASHNPVKPKEWNGIKSFINGRPITFKMEQEVESNFRLFDVLEKDGYILSVSKNRGKIFDNVEKARKEYKDNIKKEARKDGLVFISNKSEMPAPLLMQGKIIPIDFAYGSAAATKDKLSPQIEILLELGAVLVGYGAIQDSERTNYRIGAAYIYGETDYKIENKEILALAQGKYGYGENSRVIFFPKNYEFKNKFLIKEAMVFGGNFVFFDIDNPLKKDLCRNLEKEISDKEILPVCSVDCDCDRFVTTSVKMAKSDKEKRYLSGDTMIEFFAFNLENVKEVVFTVESGMSIEKALVQKGLIPAVVAVGDRAIADYIVVKNKKGLLGGEPSGHMIFSEKINNKIILKDDPILTYLKLISVVRKTKKSFDEIIDEITKNIPEIYYSIRYAFGPNKELGISRKEKILLEKYDRESGDLSDYAKKFIIESCNIFAKAYSDTWLKIDDFKIIKSEEFKKYKIAFFKKRSLREELKVLVEDVWGEEHTIKVAFYSKDKKNRFRKAGEIISRNSGTSPKNSSYVKFWYEHYPTGRKISERKVKKVCDCMSNKRVRFTDEYLSKIKRLLS